jgi:hypothetical protein
VKKAARLVVDAESNEVVLQERSGDRVEQQVSRIFQPQLEITLVTLQGVGLSPSAALYCRKPPIAAASDKEPVGV